MSGLYFHIPFCQRKCAYCDFFSVVATAEEINDYVDLLEQHLAWAASQSSAVPIETVYFGGGTPSLLSPGQIDRILKATDRCFGISADTEVSMEANPGTVSAERLAGYRAAGVNRLSLGLQTCNDQHLAQLGRLHDHREGVVAVTAARLAGFDNLSLDLMFALPDQTAEELEDDLARYLDLQPEHLSCYGLTAEPGTPLYGRVAGRQVVLPDENFYADAFMRIHESLTAAGYDHYEIANYARPGYECRHNLGYWQRKPYLGLGAGAHSFLARGWGSRWQVPNDLAAYRQSLAGRLEPASCLETFDRQSALKETVYLALRTRLGVADDDLQTAFGCTLKEAFPQEVTACTPWLQHHSGRWAFSPSAWLLFDNLVLHFI